MITAKELRERMAKRRPVRLVEIEQAANEAADKGRGGLDSSTFGGRPLATSEADELRHQGYDVVVDEIGGWVIYWERA